MHICFVSIVGVFDNKLGIKKIKVNKIIIILPRGLVQSVVGELRSRKPKTCCAAKKKKKEKKKPKQTNIIIEGHKYSPFNHMLCPSFRSRC